MYMSALAVASLLLLATVHAREHACATASQGLEIVLDCGGDLISAVDFASYGTPSGTCNSMSGTGSFAVQQTCNAAGTRDAVENQCLGHSTCMFTVDAELFGSLQACGDDRRWLSAQVGCGDSNPHPAAVDGPPPRRTSLGWQLMALLLFIFSVYLALGIGFKVQKQGAKGFEAIPHVEMWRDLPFLVWVGRISHALSQRSCPQRADPQPTVGQRVFPSTASL